MKIVRTFKFLRFITNFFGPLFSSSRWPGVFFGMSFLLVVFSVVFPAWRLLPIIQGQPFIPLHYNVYFGIDQFGPWYDIFIAPTVGALVLCLNIILAARTYKDHPMISQLFTVMTLCVEALMALSVFFLILLNV